MFTKGFDRYVCDGDFIECEADGFTCRATIHDDDDCTPPWENEDGYGPVSDWTTRDKGPGERVLNEDGTSKRFYDFAEACQIARRDGWGYLPGRLALEYANGKTCDGGGVARCVDERGDVVTWRGVRLEVTTGENLNGAVRELYALVRNASTAREIAALAAEQDFRILKAWCNNEWHYYGVSVTVEKDGVTLVDQYECATWGIEGNYPDSDNSYFREVANDLLPEALNSARAELAELSPKNALGDLAPEMLAAMKSVLYAHDTGNNGAAMGEAILCRQYAERFRDIINRAEAL